MRKQAQNDGLSLFHASSMKQLSTSSDLQDRALTKWKETEFRSTKDWELLPISEVTSAPGSTSSGENH